MKKEHASRQSVESVEAVSPPCEDTDVHRPTLVIKFKQVASTGDGMKQRLRHVKTWTSTIKNADTPTSISDTQINCGAEDSFGASKEREVGKEVRRHSNGNENAGVPIGIGTRGGDIVQNGRCVREKVGIPAKKNRSFSESTMMPTKHDNIFQQMSTIPRSRMSEPTSGLDANHDSFNSEMDTSCDLFDSDHEMIPEDDVPLASLKSKFAVASGVRNTEAHRNGLPNDAHSQLVSGNGSCSALDDFPPSISESNSRRSFSRRSASRDSSVSRIDEPVIEAQKSLQRDSAYNEGTTDDIAGNAMPHLVSNRPTSPDIDRPDVGAPPHLEPSSESTFRSPSEMPILIDETQTNDLEALDLFGQWRPNATDDGEMELVSEVGENPSELVSEVGGKPSELVSENPSELVPELGVKPLELGPEVGVKPSELVPEVGRKPSTLWEAGTVSRGGCRVKLPSTGSGTTRNDVAPRTDGRVELANDTTCEMPDRPRTGCRVKLPRSTSESDGTSVARVKSTVRMLLPRSACPSEDPPNLTGLPETSPIMETSYTTEATVKRKPSAVFLADMRLKLSLKKKRKRKRERLTKCDKSHEIENWAVDSPAVSYASYVMFEDEVKLPMEGSNDSVSDPAEESEAAPKSPLETSELTATDAGLTPNQNASCSSLLDGKIIKRKKNRLSLPRKSISDGSLHGRKMVAFSAVPPITNYAGGRRVTCGQLVNGQVWLTRRHFKEYDLKKVGSETLLLQCLGGDDVTELKVQIQQEEAHRRKEKRCTSTIGFDLVSDVYDTSVDSDDEPLLKYVVNAPAPDAGIDANSDPVDLGIGGDSQSPDLGVGGDSRSPDLGAGGDSRSKFGICSLFSGAAASEVHNMEVVAVRSGAVFRKHCKVVLKAKRHNKSASKSKHSGREATGKNKTQHTTSLSLPDKPGIDESRPANDSQSTTEKAKLKLSKKKRHRHHRNTGHLKKASDKDESQSKHVTDDSTIMHTAVDIHEESKNVTDVSKTVADIQKESINSLFDRVIDDPMEAVNGDAESNFLVDHSVDDPTEAVDEGGGTSKESDDPLMDHSIDDPTDVMDKDTDICKESDDPLMDHVVGDRTEAIYEDADICKEKSNSHGHHSIHDPSKAVDENADICKESINSRMDLPIDDPTEAVNVAMSLPDKPDVHKSHHAKDSQRKTKEAKLKPSKRKHHHRRRVTSGHLKKVSDKDESKSKHVTDDSKTMKTVVDIHKENKNVTDVLKTIADIQKESINSLFDRVIDDPMEAVNGDAESNFLVDHSADDPTEAVDEGGGTSKESSDPLADHSVNDPTVTMDKDIDTCKESSDPMMDHAVDDPTEAIYEDADVCKEKSNSHGHHSIHDPSKAVDENADTCKESINSCMDRAIDDPIEAVNVAMSLPDKSHIHKSRPAKDSQSTTKEAKLKLSKRKHHHRRRVTSGHLKKVSDKSKSKHVTDDSKTIVDIHEESKNVTDVSKTVADIHKESSDPLVDHVRDGPTEAVDAGTCNPIIDHSLDDLTEAMDKDTDTCKWSSNSIVAHVVGDPTLTLDEDADTFKSSSDPHVDHSVHDPSKAVDENADTRKESINSLVDRAIDDPIEAVNVAMSLPDKSHIPESRPAKDSQSKTEEAKHKLSKRKHHHRRRVTSGHLKKVSDKDESRSKHMTDDSKTMTTVVDIRKGCTNSPIDDAVTEPTGAVRNDIDMCKVSSIPLVDDLVDDPTEAIYEDADVCKEKSNSHGDRAVDDPKEAVDNDIDTCKESRDPTMDHTTDAVDDPTGDEDADICKESNNSPVGHTIDDHLEAVYEDVDSIPLVDHEFNDLADAVNEDAGTSRESSDLFVDHSVDDPAKALDEDIDICKESINSLMNRTVDDPIEAVDEDAESNPLVDHSVDDLAETVDEDIGICRESNDHLVDHSVDDSTEAVDDPTVVTDADICKESSNSPLDHTIGDPMDPVVDHSVHDPAKAVDEGTDAWKSFDNSVVDHSIDDPTHAVAEGTNTPGDTLACSISLVDYAIEEDYSSVVEYRTGSRTSEHANEQVCTDQTSDTTRTEKVECARDFAKKSERVAEVTTVTDIPCRNMQDSDVTSALSNSASSQSVSNDPHPGVHERVQAANSRTEDVTNCTVEFEITRLNRLLEAAIPDVCVKTNVTGTASDQPQPKPAEPHPAVKQALALIHRRRQEASLPGPTVTSLVHLEEAAASSCRNALGERPTASCAEPRHDRTRKSESSDSPQRKRKHSSSCGDDDDRKTERGDMRERAGSGSGHRSGSSRKGESCYRSGTSSHRSGNSRESGSDHRSDKRHRSESSRSSESRRGSESSHRSEKEHRYESSRRSGSDHRSGNSHRPESDHRSPSSNRSEKERRSESSRRSGSDHRSDTSSYKSGTSSHRSESSSHRSGSSHRSDTSSHRSESVRGSGNDNKSGSRLRTVPESSTLGQEHSNSVARNDNSTERNCRVRLEEPSEASSCQQQGYVGRNTKHKLPEDVSPPGVRTMNTHDICKLPSSLPSMPPLVREASPESDRNVSAGSPLRQTDGLSPPKLTAQPWHLIEIDNTRAGGRHGGSKKKRKKSEDKTIKDSSKAPSFHSEESVLFIRGSNVGDGSTNDRRPARNGCRQDGATWSRQEDRNDDKHCRTGENCKSGNKKRIASDNDTTQLQDRSGHSIVASDDDLFSLSSHQRLSGQSIHRERNFQLSDTTGDNVQELVSDVGLKPNDGHRRDKSQVSQDCCDRSLAKKSRDSFDCHDGGSDDTPNSSRGKPAKNSHVSDHGRHTDSRVSDNRHRTTGHRSSHRSDSEHSSDDNRPEGAFRHSRGVIITPAVAPPTRETVTADIGLLSGPQLKEPYCSNPSDVPDRPR